MNVTIGLVIAVILLPKGLLSSPPCQRFLSISRYSFFIFFSGVLKCISIIFLLYESSFGGDRLLPKWISFLSFPFYSLPWFPLQWHRRRRSRLYREFLDVICILSALLSSLQRGGEGAPFLPSCDIAIASYLCSPPPPTCGLPYHQHFASHSPGGPCETLVRGKGEEGGRRGKGRHTFYVMTLWEGYHSCSLLWVVGLSAWAGEGLRKSGRQGGWFFLEKISLLIELIRELAFFPSVVPRIC